MKQQVIIAASDDILRSGLCTIFAKDTRVANVYEAYSSEELSKSLRTFSVHLVVVDQALGVDFATMPAGKFVVLTANPDIQSLRIVHQYGGRGYLSVRASKELLYMTLNPQREYFLIDPILTPWLIPYLNDALPDLTEDISLTKRQREIDRLAREGMSRRSIAERLFIAESTVKTHLKHISRKRNASKQKA
jgi:DNA-binding NarL/FixJ family response regulator